MGKAFISTFTYECELAFNKEGEDKAIEIPKQCIRYITVDHDYENKMMPLIYINVNLLPSTYNKMVPEQGKSKMYLKLYSTRNKGSTSATPKKVIYGEFDYLMADDPNSYKELDEVHEDRGTSYKNCRIGLYSLDLQKKNQKSFGGIMQGKSTQALVKEALKDMNNIVLQPFDYDTSLGTFVCPNLSSVVKFIGYLNNKASFYKGNYMFYMDFEKTYLRSFDGSYIDAKDGDHPNIAIDVRDLTKYQGLSSGIVEDPDQDAYIIYVPGTDCQISIDRSSSSIIGNISAVNVEQGTNIQSSSVNTSKITNISDSGSSIITVSQDKNAASNLKTKIAENASTLIISKIDMDSRIFTPNKQYTLANYEDNPKYTGVYYMLKKHEIYLRSGDHMNCQMTITFKKCADFA